MRLKGNCCAFNIVALKSRKQTVLKCLGNLTTMLFHLFDDHQTSPKRFDVTGKLFYCLAIGGKRNVTLDKPLPRLARLVSQDFESIGSIYHAGHRLPQIQRNVILSANHGRPQGGEEHFLKAHLTCAKDLH